MLGFFSFYWSITHHNNLEGIKTISNRSKARFKINNWSNKTLSPIYNILLVTIIKKYKRHYLYQSVVFCRNICSYPFHSFQRLNFSCTVGCGGWKIPQLDNLWTGSPGTRGYRSRCCWRFSSHVVLLRKKITNGERYKLFISTIFPLYSISLHFRLEFFFFFSFCSKYQFFLKPLA